ncbi:hypothetical protein ES708_32392 [subsurface metagenome]
METILTVVVIILAVIVMAMLIWLISSIFANRREIAGQSAGIGLLQQQLEALKAAQDGTKETLHKSLQSSQETLSRNLQ